MEKKPPAQKEVRKKMEDSTFFTLATTLFTLTAIDFAIHSNGGVSDPETRAFFQSMLGDWIKYIGNFGYSAAMAIMATGILRLARHADTIKGEADFSDHLVGILARVAPAGILALVLTVEGFSGNNHFIGDMTTTIMGIETGKAVSQEALHRVGFGRRHSIRNKVDPLFPLKEIPTSLPQWQYQAI